MINLDQHQIIKAIELAKNDGNDKDHLKHPFSGFLLYRTDYVLNEFRLRLFADVGSYEMRKVGLEYPNIRQSDIVEITYKDAAIVVLLYETNICYNGYGDRISIGIEGKSYRYLAGHDICIYCEKFIIASTDGDPEILDEMVMKLMMCI